MDPGIDNQPDGAFQLAILQGLQPLHRIIVETQFIPEAFGVKCPSFAERGVPAVL